MFNPFRRKAKPVVSPEQAYIDEAKKKMDENLEAQNASGVFFSQGTEADYIEFQRQEEGTKAWYDRLKNLK